MAVYDDKNEKIYARGIAGVSITISVASPTPPSDKDDKPIKQLISEGVELIDTWPFFLWRMTLSENDRQFVDDYFNLELEQLTAYWS